MNIENLFEAYTKAGQSKTASSKRSEEEIERLEKILKSVPAQCSQLADQWKGLITETYRVQVCNRVNDVRTDYALAKGRYVKLGTALLALEDYSKTNYNLSVAKVEPDQYMIHSCIKSGVMKMHNLRKKYLENKSALIRELVNHLNCFTKLPSLLSVELYGAKEPFTLMGPINWDEACEKARAALPYLTRLTDKSEDLPSLKKETEETVEFYRSGVRDQHYQLKSKQEKVDKLTKERMVYSPILWGGPDSEQSRVKRESYKAILDPDSYLYEKDYFSKHTIPDLKGVHPNDLAEFERDYCPVSKIVDKLGVLELSMTSYRDSLERLFRLLDTQGLYWTSYIREPKPVSALKLRRDVKTICEVVSKRVLEQNQTELDRRLNAIYSAIGYKPDRSIFTALYESDEQMAAFYAAIERFKQETISSIKVRLASLSSDNEKIQAAKKREEGETFDKIVDLCLEDPARNGLCYVPGGYDQVQSLALLTNINTCADKRCILPSFVNPFDRWSCSCFFPQVVQWQSKPDACNLEFVYEQAAAKPEAVRCLHSTLLTILLAFPIKKVRINFIDPMTTNDGAILTTRLGTQVCSVVNRESDIRQLIDQWQARAAMVGKYCDNVTEYNEREKTILVPYEINVLLGRMTPSVEALLSPFIQNGYKYGVYFFALSEGTQKRGEPFNHISRRRGWPSEKEGCLAMSPMDDPELFKMLISYINSFAKKEEIVSAIRQDADQLAAAPYGDAINGFSVPVGEANGTSVHFRLSNQHIHSFVIGQTGQGKSVFLHDVIAGAILRYSPEQFQVYLLDFKLAGEELYHYKGVKHVRALLANGSDLQLTYQVLKDLRGQMQERSDLMREAGARTIEEYDKGAGQKRFPRILLVVDECQELFRDNSHRQAGEASIMIDIRSIIEDVARIGRSQGVHLLFATQTLSGTQLPTVIKNNLTDCFVFKCVQEDAEQLVPGSGKKVQQLKVGHLLYNSADGETLFHAYLPDVNRMVQKAAEKAATVSIKEPRFVFDGKAEVAMGPQEKKLLMDDTGRWPAYTMGRSADVQQAPVKGVLKQDLGENILFIGYNSSQVTRASFSTLLSLMASNKAGNLGYTFYCMDLLQSDDPAVYKPLEMLAERGLKMIPQSSGGEVLSEIAGGIRKGQMQKIVLFILGQERFKAVRDEYEVPVQEQPATGTGLSQPRPFGRPQPLTVRSELRLILEKGPEMGVHCLVQLDRLSKLLFESSVTSRFVYRMFNYVCLLRTEKDAEVRLGVEGVYPHQLSEEEANLGAYLINDSSGKKTKFTPFKYLDEESIDQLL